MRRIEKRVVAINVLGALGYTAQLLAWTFFVSIVLMILIDSSLIQVPLNELDAMPVGEKGSPGTLSAVAYVVTGLVALVSVVIVICLPFLIGLWGSKFTRLLLRVTKLPIGHRELLVCKLIVLLLASLGMYIAGFVLPSEYSDVYAVLIGGAIAAVVTVLLFTLQHYCAKRLKITAEKTW